MPPRATPRTRRAQRGTTLLEGLVAFLVLSLGMLSVVRVQTQMRLNTDVARQRSEAVRIAQEDIERLRAFSVIAVRAGATAFAGVASATRQVNSDSGQPSNTSYSL
ncbi:MAG: pilus assembly protein PilV, partial [Burkholderiaceae bacterium]